VKERDDVRTLIQSVLDQTKAVIYIKDPDGIYRFANAQFGNIFNLTLDQIIGHTDYEILTKPIADEFRKNDVHVLSSGTPLEAEEKAVHHDGREHIYISHKFPIRDSTGQLYGVCGISTDVTELRALEHQLTRAKRMEAMGLLAGGIAHD